MKIKLVDVFDRNYVTATYDKVESVLGNTIYFEDGDEIEFNPKYEDWEKVEED